jgi:hypothetical protein
MVSDCESKGRDRPTRLTVLSPPSRVSDGLSIHHQEFKTVHTATGICQTDTATCLLAESV